jgi:hypothetical protein
MAREAVNRSRIRAHESMGPDNQYDTRNFIAVLDNQRQGGLLPENETALIPQMAVSSLEFGSYINSERSPCL